MNEDKKEENEDLASQVYQFVNDRYTVPEISEKIFPNSGKLGQPDFFKICDAVDKLIEEGLVYFRDSDGVLLDLQR